MSILDKIEKEERRNVLREVGKNSKISFIKHFIISLFMFPFLIFEGMYIPILGQLLFILSIILTFFYLLRTKSWKALLGLALGFIISFTIIMASSEVLTSQGAPFFYFLLGLSTALTITYCIGISVALLFQYENAMHRLNSGFK